MQASHAQEMILNIGKENEYVILFWNMNTEKKVWKMSVALVFLIHLNQLKLVKSQQKAFVHVLNIIFENQN